MNKRHRIFVAINLPEDIKGVLARYENKFQDLPAKWTPKDNLHVTLVFLGDMTDQQLGEVCLAVKNIASNHEGFNIVLDKVSYGPDEKIPPRMLWASGEKSKELTALKTDLQNALLEKVNFNPEYRVFSPHVTLARISAFAWRQIAPEERPEVTENIEMTFTVDSIEVMESEMSRGGPKYTIIESHSLQ